MRVRFSSSARRSLVAFAAVAIIGLTGTAEALGNDFVGDPYPLEKCFCDEFLDDVGDTQCASSV